LARLMMTLERTNLLINEKIDAREGAQEFCLSSIAASQL